MSVYGGGLLHLLALWYGTPALEVHPKGSRRRGATLPSFSTYGQNNNWRCALWDMHLPIVFRNNSMQMVSNRLCRCLILTILVPHSKLRIKSSVVWNDMQLHSSSTLESTYRNGQLKSNVHSLAKSIWPNYYPHQTRDWNSLILCEQHINPCSRAISQAVIGECFLGCGGGGGIEIQIRGTWS